MGVPVFVCFGEVFCPKSCSFVIQGLVSSPSPPFVPLPPPTLFTQMPHDCAQVGGRVGILFPEPPCAAGSPVPTGSGTDGRRLPEGWGAGHAVL